MVRKYNITFEFLLCKKLPQVCLHVGGVTLQHMSINDVWVNEPNIMDVPYSAFLNLHSACIIADTTI